jgi:RimJ/RimL family protein N-acetyltransferase
MGRRIESGKIRMRAQGSPSQEVPYEMALLDESHLPQIMVLHDIIFSTLSSQDLLQPFSADFMREHLGRKGFIIGVFSGTELIAFRSVYFPDGTDQEWNLGLDLDLPEEELGKVANLQMVCVHPSYWGNSLAFRMNIFAIRAVKDMGKYYHLCATVHPYNYWNVRILLRSGFVIKKITEKYGGKLRYVVYQDLRKPMRFAPEGECSARLTDIHDQKGMLEKGLCGVKIKEIRSCVSTHLEERANGFEVIFGKQLS